MCVVYVHNTFFVDFACICVCMSRLCSVMYVHNTFLSFGERSPKLRRCSSDSTIAAASVLVISQQPARDLDHKVFIGGLACTTDEVILFHFLSQFGSVKNVTVKRNPVTGQSRRYAFVKFYQAPSKAIFEGPWTLEDHVIRVTKYLVSSTWKNHYYSDEEGGI